MVKFSNVSIALVAASTALLSAAHAKQYTTLAEWKQSDYYQEALDKNFLPSATGKGSSGNTGEFSMNTNTGDSSYAAEEKKRFDQALATIAELQKLHPHAKFSLETPFALLSHNEFLAYVNRNNVNPDLNPLHRPASTPASASNSSNAAPMNGNADGGPKTSAAAPGEFVDWQQRGCVTAVKDQAQCGACWAFSATAAMESGLCVETRGARLPNLADQQLISCDNQGQSQGCGGGYASYTMDWIAQARSGKMCTLESYPFASSDGSVPACKLASCNEVDIGVAGFEAIRKDPSKLEDAVRERPVSVFLYSGSKAFQFYSGGILTGESCDKTGAHSGLAVGFGEENGTPYWRVKNQWGTKWGESGYVRIQRRYSRDDEGACGIELYASYPTFKSGITAAPTAAPTQAPTAAPTQAPTEAPTEAPTAAPTVAPTVAPTQAPTAPPTVAPTAAPTEAPTSAPTPVPTTEAPTQTPTQAPTTAPTPVPTTVAPTAAPTEAPTATPTQIPTAAPTAAPTARPTQGPIQRPTPFPTQPMPTPALTEPAHVATPATTTTAPSSPVQTNPFLAPVLPDPYQGVETPATVAPRSVGISNDNSASAAVQDGVDFLGNDLVNTTAMSVADCRDQCQRFDGCNAFTFTTWKSGTCWLKSRAGLVVPNAMATSGSLYDISKCTRTNTPQEVGYDYPGNDVSQVHARHADECYAQCSATVACHAFTWSAMNGGTCFLKTHKVAAAVHHTRKNSKDAPAFVSAIVYKCQAIQQHTDIVGQDIGNAPARSPEACCALCHQRTGCAGFAWSDFERGTCWFKSGTGNTVAKGSVVSASL